MASEETEETGVGFTPETVEPAAEEAFCFLNEDRLCTPTCMAFSTNPPETRSKELSPGQQRCTLLHNAERASRHLVIIADVLFSGERRRKTVIADQKREAASVNIIPPTNPFGSRT